MEWLDRSMKKSKMKTIDKFIDVFFVDNNLLEEKSFKVLIDGGLIVLFFNFLFELFSDIISNINVLINFLIS